MDKKLQLAVKWRILNKLVDKMLPCYVPYCMGTI